MYLLVRNMKDLLTAADTDTKAVKTAEKQIAAAASDLSMTVMDSIVSVNDVLTPEQRKELHTRMIRSTLGAGGPRQHHDEEPISRNRNESGILRSAGVLIFARVLPLWLLCPSAMADRSIKWIDEHQSVAADQARLDRSSGKPRASLLT